MSKLESSTERNEKIALAVVLTNSVGLAYCVPMYFALAGADPASAAAIPTRLWIGVAIYAVGTRPPLCFVALVDGGAVLRVRFSRLG